MRARRPVPLLLLAAVGLGAALLGGDPALAYIHQVDGQLLPVGTKLQACLDRAGTGESTAGAVDAVEDARVLPEAYRPVEDPPGSGVYEVTFAALGEGAGYKNLFGYYWTDADPSDPANLHMVFDCRPDGTCDCPCNPTAMRDGDGSATSWLRTIDFADEPGFRAGRAIGFWIRTPQRFEGANNNDHCGGPDADNQDHRTYFTSAALNDDGDFVHFLVLESATREDTYYFGFEDLFRGGDNDFEDMLVRVEGLVPLCEPQVESCNGADDDCDGSIDEGLERPCTAECGAGVQVCAAGVWGACDGPTRETETCDGTDEDCDGEIDEGLSRACTNDCGAGTEVCRAGSYVDCDAPTPTVETCDGADEDCDGSVDEDLTRACFSACGSGVEACTAGSWGGCTAPVPGVEDCDGIDDDCDGLIDEGLERPCSTECGSGSEVCVNGDWVGCSAPAGEDERCNGLDDDCDGDTDEDLARACSNACGAGLEACVAGAWDPGTCDAPTASDEVCNNVDDDCDGVIDDGNPGGGAACLPDGLGGYTLVDEGAPVADEEVCNPGVLRCVGGDLRCLGASSATREVCNCVDDDCDGAIDEDGDGLCPGGACIDCACVSPCADGEFPCPTGRFCDESHADPERGLAGYCLPGLCEGVECAETEACEPRTGACVDVCADRHCPDGFACVRGGCVEDNCYGRGCPMGEVCLAGACAADACFDVDCEAGAFCRDGACVAACTEPCAEDEVCRDGRCVDDPCGGECGGGASCVDGACVADVCVPGCRSDRVCVGGVCVDDPCARVDCPDGAACVDGDCTAPWTPPPPPPRRGLATGGGGFQCNAAPDTPLPAGALALWLAAFALARRRRPSSATSRRGARARALLVAGLALPVTTGCEVDPFCFDCDAPPPGPDAGSRDAAVQLRDGEVPDGCVPRGEETCNGVDDDCDGQADEDFVDDPGHCGGCGIPCNLPHAFPACSAGECVVERCEIGWHDLNRAASDGCEYACPPSGDEICDERDNDCDGRVDEDFDVATDPANCGACGEACAFANATPRCVAGACVRGACRPGYVDLDGEPDNGCEYLCAATGTETCNQRDDDCDGAVDEGFDVDADPANCGRCGAVCSFPNATARCVAGECVFDPTACLPGFADVDGSPRTGCEYACPGTGGGEERCNGVDDDCDGSIDEADPSLGLSCGSAVGACTQGVWVCELGRLVCSGERGPTAEVCNGVDDDCDGDRDEPDPGGALPGTGGRCGNGNMGACAYGTVVCAAGALTCGGAYAGPGTEVCNGIDDDCDGTADDLPAPPATTPASCLEDRGVCAARTATCRGADGWGCDLPATHQPVETICDGLDNDCDGDTDEGCLALAPAAADVRLDPGTGGADTSVAPDVAGDGADGVYVTWMDLQGAGDAHAYFRRSADGGATWDTASWVDANDGPAIGPRLAVTGTDGDTVAVVWSDFRGSTGASSYRRIMGNRSTDAGDTFPATDVRANAGQNVDSFNVDVATSGDRVYAVYETFVDVPSSARDVRHVFLVRSGDGGATWSGPIQVDHGDHVAVPSFVAATPRVAAVGSNVYVVWRDNRDGALDVYFNRSTDHGATFAATDTRLDTGTPAGDSTSFSPSIDALGDNVYVAWIDDRSGQSFDVWWNASDDEGATWLAGAVCLDEDALPHDSIEPQVVAVTGDEVLVGWVDYRFGFPDVLVARSTDAGLGFTDPVRLDTGTDDGVSGSFDARLATDGTLVVAVWSDDRSGRLDVYANYSLDRGATWQPDDVRLDAPAGEALPGLSDSEAPVPWVAGGVAHVVWRDHRNGERADVFYRRLE